MRTRSRNLPPSRVVVGTPNVLPARSQSAISIPLAARISMWAEPSVRHPRPVINTSMPSGSLPINSGLRARMPSFTPTPGLPYASPMPWRPASLSTLTSVYVRGPCSIITLMSRILVLPFSEAASARYRERRAAPGKNPRDRRNWRREVFLMMSPLRWDQLPKWQHTHADHVDHTLRTQDTSFGCGFQISPGKVIPRQRRSAGP